MTKLELSVNNEYNFSQLVSELVSMDYQRVDMVVDHGDLAVRGAIIDIFPSNQNTPLRLEFNGNVLESMRSFNVLTQRSISFVKNTTILAVEQIPALLIRSDDFIESEDHLLSDFRRGDYVVHENYGISIFNGLVRMKAGSIEGEFYHLQFADTQELFLPLDQSQMLHKYAAGDARPQLSVLGDKSWPKAKQKAQKAAKNIAFELFNLYRQRELTPGIAFKEDSEEQLLVEKDFPYEETPDQERAIVEVKADMEKTVPMDRLVCGDVGFGKTEVAIRAAFKAAVSGKQIALVAPTTILVSQHYHNFKKRFEKYGLRVEMLSRFHTLSQNKRIITEIKKGVVDIAIGTHRLLQKDVNFPNLGLLIIDEEQRFGVEHKEFFKKMQVGVDILAMSATPIPRTLYLALSGARDISILQTAPENRHPIKTILTEYNDNVVKTAVEYELKRDGQIFFLHNNIKDIEKTAGAIKKLVPDAKVLIAHGQMPQHQLEDTVLEFIDGKADILVCTTIIENGIDIPRVNTIIINNADYFGLSQLHQIRGRVGRSTTKAYAYLLYEKNKMLNPDAEQRLHALKEFTALGAGYKIALRDLEIRGSGNILGPQQSGHVQGIGFTLFCKLMEESIRELKGEKIEKEELFTLPSDRENFIPYEYMEEETLRISFYQRIMDARQISEVQSIEEEMKDRFGKVPQAAKNLLTTISRQLRERT